MTPSPDFSAPKAPDAHASGFSLRDRVAGRTIFIGVCGGIAAYKTATVVSRLAQAGANVFVAMTPAATRFVGPTTFQALSANPVFCSPWDHIDAMDPQHISLANRTAAALIAPCTMDCLARLATGRADDVVSLILSAIDRRKVPVLLAPAMNTTMWQQPATQRNVATLVQDGFSMVGPGSGWQACREVGEGRMSEPEELIEAVAAACGRASRA
ncbi:MAG: hypothetical protein NTV94_03745 [Planctomycetota bacterium]|nr:hypothetical protein [Planctomycetota bacterium]